MPLPDETHSDAKRRRGRPLRIDRSQIIRVARTLDPQTMTMQAIADELGVDRKAINYHVSDRDGLRRLVATDVFEQHFEEAFVGHLEVADRVVPDDWRSSVRAWAAAIRDGMVATGDVTNYYRIEGGNVAIFGSVELVLQRMLAAGFDIATASRGLVFLTRFAMGVGRDMVLEKQIGEHPQGPEVKQALAAADPEDYAALRMLIEAGYNDAGDIETQFDFEVETFIEGMERRLDRVKRAAGR